MPGAENLFAGFAPLTGLLARQLASEEGRIAAICARSGGGARQSRSSQGATRPHVIPVFEGDLIGAEYEDRAVVADDKFVLGNGPANALVWALAIVDKALGNDRSRGVANGMLLSVRQ